MDRHFRKHFAVDFDAGFAQPVHQTTVRYFVGSCRSIDPRDPKSAELSFSELSALIRRAKGAHDSGIGRPKDLAFFSVKSLCQFQHLFVLSLRIYASFDSCHDFLPPTFPPIRS